MRTGRKIVIDNLDKFYTHPDIAKMFVDKINEICPLADYDMVLEPSAGSGNILRYLPDSAIGLDLAPEADGITQQDFFEYKSPYDPLTNPIKIAVVGNPPFGTGYMNPLAKGFFNHAAPYQGCALWWPVTVRLDPLLANRLQNKDLGGVRILQ